MIDLKRLRDEPAYRSAIERKRVKSGLIDATLDAFETQHRLSIEVEDLRAKQNAASKEIGKVSANERPEKIAAATKLKEELTDLEPKLTDANSQLRELALQIPNPAHESVPDGGEADGVVVRAGGDETPPPALDHADFAASKGWIETKKAAEMSGSRFSYLMGEAVMLEFELVQWVMRRLVNRGFIPVVPPVLVKEDQMEAAGFFPTDRSAVYEVDRGRDQSDIAVSDDEVAFDGLYLVGTSEVPLAGLHRRDLLDAADLPLRYCGFSTCFRREAGTYGKDTRGIFRVHQFDKVEMFIFSDPAKSWEEHELLLDIEESIVADLGLPYRIVNIAAGDLGAAAAKKYDVEVWLPSEQRYRELTSCSNYLDYSARRLETRVRKVGGNEYVHTLNGTGVAVGRLLLFLWEHYQQPEGTFAPPSLRD